MGKPNRLTNHNNNNNNNNNNSIKENKKKVAVNLAKGGGIGLGIVFIGGALVTATLVTTLTIRRWLLKSRNSKNGNECHSTGSNERIEKFIAADTTDGDEIKGVLSFPPDCSPEDMYQELSNGRAKTSGIEEDTSGMISHGSFFTEEKKNLELYGGKGDLNFDDKDGSDGSTQCNGSVVKSQTGEFSLAVVEGDQTQFQHSSMNKDPYDVKIDLTEEERTSEIPDVDHIHSTEADSQLMQVNKDQKVRELKCTEAAETAEADQSALIIQKSSLHDYNQDSTSRGCLPLESIKTDILVPLLHNSSLCKDENLNINCEEGSQAFETVETLDVAEAAAGKAVHVYKCEEEGRIILVMEEKEKNCNQLEAWLITESAEQRKRDDTLEAAHRNHQDEVSIQHDGSLIVPTVEVLKSHEKLDSDQEGSSGLLIVPTVEVFKPDTNLDGGFISTVITTGEIDHENDQEDGLTLENARELEEDKAFDPAQGKDKTDILMLEKEVDESKLAVVVDTAPSSDLQNRLTVEQENPLVYSEEDHCISDEIIFEEVTCERSATQDSNPCLESAQGVSSQYEDTPATTEADIVGGATEEANIGDKVDENSEGRGDSSAESLEELSMELTGLKFNNQVEYQQPAENKTLQAEERSYSNEESLQNANEGKDKMLELAKQNDQPTNSLKPKTFELRWTFMGLLWSYCFWHFGLPYLKICLIVILVILLSKIQRT